VLRKQRELSKVMQMYALVSNRLGQARSKIGEIKVLNSVFIATKLLIRQACQPAKSCFTTRGMT